MEYAILIYCEEDALPEGWTDDEKRKAFFEDYGAVSRDLETQGAFLSARRLATTDTATTVRVRDEEVTVTDGPFAETKEALGGFFLIEAPDLDAALAWARRIPGARIGSVEVRPIHQYGG